jgi:chorismate mutase / prephenate dehydratase
VGLDKLRFKIDEIDEQILALLNERMQVVADVGAFKSKTGGAIYRPEREKAILERMNSLNSGLLNATAIEAIYLEIFAVSRNLELPEKIAYLGPEGSFTHQAAESRFGAMSDYLPMSSIYAVFKALESKRAKYGVVPIENNSDGIVGETLDLLGESELKIVAELQLPIHQAFVSKAEHLTDIKRVYSKDKAFGQCRDFLVEHSIESIELIPVESTAKAAKLAAEDATSAAICSHIAAKLYNIPTLFENIEDIHTNKTRFIILSDFKNSQSEHDKTSILAKLPHKPGSLVQFLQDFDAAEVNLLKIESRPARGDEEDFSSWFYIDFEGHFDDKKIQEILSNHATEVKWLGSFVNAQG